MIRRNPLLGKVYLCPRCRALVVLMISWRGNYLYADADTVGAGVRCFDRGKGHVPHFATCANPGPRRGRRGQS